MVDAWGELAMIAARILAASTDNKTTTKNNDHDENDVYVIIVLEKNAKVGGRCGAFFVPHPDPTVVGSC